MELFSEKGFSYISENVKKSKKSKKFKKLL